MGGYQPPYTMTTTILHLVVEIGELLGRWSAQAGHASPLLRRENRIRTIQASLAIEQNSLSTEQVTALMAGKRVLAPLKDIQEVRNAIQVYEQMQHWQSTSLDDLLAAHRLLMAGLMDAPGHLRRGDVGIYRDRQLIHMAPPSGQLPRLIGDLLQWLQHTDIHPLIASAIFHYEFEFIHPFADGNGRMGRLWQTLILSEWRAELAWLPIETVIHDNQQHYYQVLRDCDRLSDCSEFIVFILQQISAALRQGITAQSKTMAGEVAVQMSEEMAVQMSEETREPLPELAVKILAAIRANPAVTIAQLAEKMAVSRRTVERQLKFMQTKGRVQRRGATKNGVWHIL